MRVEWIHEKAQFTPLTSTPTVGDLATPDSDLSTLCVEDHLK